MLGLFLGLIRIKSKPAPVVAGQAITDNLGVPITDSLGNQITSS